MNFILSNEARDDLIDIQDYIAQDSPRQAARVVDDIFATLEQACGQPDDRSRARRFDIKTGALFQRT